MKFKRWISTRVSFEVLTYQNACFCSLEGPKKPRFVSVGPLGAGPQWRGGQKGSSPWRSPWVGPVAAWDWLRTQGIEHWCFRQTLKSELARCFSLCFLGRVNVSKRLYGEQIFKVLVSHEILDSVLALRLEPDLRKWNQLTELGP